MAWAPPIEWEDMAQGGTVTFDCTVGDLCADSAVVVWALLSLYHRSPCCCTSFVAHFALKEATVVGSQCSLSVCPQKIRQIKVHMIPIIVAIQSWFVTRHEYPIVHGPSKALEAISISEVHCSYASPSVFSFFFLLLHHSVHRCDAI